MREQCPEDVLLQFVSRGSAWINLNAITQIVLGFSSESAKISARKYCEIRRRRQLHCRLFSFFLNVLLIAVCSADSRPLEQLKWNPFFNAFILTYMHVMGGGGAGVGARQAVERFEDENADLSLPLHGSRNTEHPITQR